METCYEIWNSMDYSEVANLANQSELNLVPISWEKIITTFPQF